MTSRDFVYWFQGFLEIQDPKTIDEKQLEMIKKHLNMVFVHEIDPSHGDEKMQAKLDAIHKQPPKVPMPQYHPPHNLSDVKFRC